MKLTFDKFAFWHFVAWFPLIVVGILSRVTQDAAITISGIFLAFLLFLYGISMRVASK